MHKNSTFLGRLSAIALSMGGTALGGLMDRDLPKIVPEYVGPPGSRRRRRNAHWAQKHNRNARSYDFVFAFQPGAKLGKKVREGTLTKCHP